MIDHAIIFDSGCNWMALIYSDGKTERFTNFMLTFSGLCDRIDFNRISKSNIIVVNSDGDMTKWNY